MDYALNQSAWRRGWNDTKTIWTGWQFPVFELVGGGVIGRIFGWYWGVLLVLFGMFCVWLGATASAPLRQRNEARTRIIALEKEKQPQIEVHPFPSKRPSSERHNKTAWAALEVTNTSSGVDLDNASVQILELMQVFECQDEQGIGTGTYSLHELNPRWSPANVYWSERNAPANQLQISIPRGATRLAIIAFHSENGPALGCLNTPQYPPMLEHRIVIAVSSPNMNTWRGVYYIEYLPPSQDKFDFVEWDSWCSSHHVIERSTLDKEGFQP